MLSIIQEETSQIVNKINFSSLKNKKILITGASGIIGVYILSCLQEIKKEFNIEVFCWVNNDIDPIFQPLFDGCVIIKGDICDNSLLESLYLDLYENYLSGFDFIIHAAGYGQPNKFLDDKIKTIQLNTTSTVNLFKLLNAGGTFVFMSTSEVYSGIDHDNITESDIGTSSTDHPRSCYIEGKRCGEAICHAFNNGKNNVKIIRLSLAYGPGTKQNDQRVLNSLFQKAFQNGKINLLDSGSSMRTYGYISDIIEMIWNISLFGQQTVYNVAGTSKITILDLAKNIANLTGVTLSAPKNDLSQLSGVPKNVNLCLNRYLSEFNKINFVSLEDGLKKTMKWQKGLYVN